jgi:hypothetical protein
MTLDVSSSPARVSLLLTLPRAASTATRRLFDRDRDGRLSETERGPLRRYLEAKTWSGLRFSCDGREAAPALARTTLVGADDAMELQLRLETTILLDGERCGLEDGGDSTGHLPVTIVGTGASLAAPRNGNAWNVPARRPARLTLRR